METILYDRLSIGQREFCTTDFRFLDLESVKPLCECTCEELYLNLRTFRPEYTVIRDENCIEYPAITGIQQLESLI